MNLHRLPTTPEVEARISVRVHADRMPKGLDYQGHYPEAAEPCSEFLEDDDPVLRAFALRRFWLGYACALLALAITAAAVLVRCS